MNDDYFYNVSVGGEYARSENVGISAEYGVYGYLREYDRETPDFKSHYESNFYQSFTAFGLHYYF